MVETANQKERQGQPGPTPKSKEAKKLDLFGRKVYSIGGIFQLCIANQQAVLSRYSVNSWNMSKFKELLLTDSHSEFAAILEEGKVVTRPSLRASLDSADSATYTMATAIAMRRSPWLQVSGLAFQLHRAIFGANRH